MLKFLFILLLSVSTLFSQVTITQANNGTGIPGALAQNGVTPGYTILNQFSIDATTADDFTSSGQARTLIFKTPTNWRFKPNVGTLTVSAELTSTSLSVTDTTITVTYRRVNKTGLPWLRINDVEITSLDGSIITVDTIKRTGGTGIVAGAENAVFALVSNDGVLPVELVSFRAKHLKDAVELSWVTATETDNYGFEVYKNNERVGFVQGAGTKNSPTYYKFISYTAIDGVYVYKLKQIDLDGTFTFSHEISVMINSNGYTLYQNYPNPFNPTTSISYKIIEDSYVSLKIYDSNGRLIDTLVSTYHTAGTHTIQYNASHLPSGIYYYTLRSANYEGTLTMIILK